jgi:hypothetical protein
MIKSPFSHPSQSSWHVNKCVLAKCKGVVGEEDWLAFDLAWRNIINAPTVEEFEERWLQFQTTYSNEKTQSCITYLMSGFERDKRND